MRSVRDWVLDAAALAPTGARAHAIWRSASRVWLLERTSLPSNTSMFISLKMHESLRRTQQSLRWPRDGNGAAELLEFASREAEGELQLACQLFASSNFSESVKKLSHVIGQL